MNRYYNGTNTSLYLNLWWIYQFQEQWCSIPVSISKLVVNFTDNEPLSNFSSSLLGFYLFYLFSPYFIFQLQHSSNCVYRFCNFTSAIYPCWSLHNLLYCGLPLLPISFYIPYSCSCLLHCSLVSYISFFTKLS